MSGRAGNDAGRARAPTGLVSAVVATRDRPTLLADCLASLQAGPSPPDEVVVVDSCSKHGSTADVVRSFGCRYVRLDRPGASLARNAGWRAATAGEVAFVDDDVRVTPGWAEAFRSAFAAHPEASFVTGRLGLRPAETALGRPVAIFDHGEPFVIDRSVVEDFGHGANLALRRTALERVGGYDDRLGPGARWHAAEDLDLIDRLLAAGLVGRYEPGAAAYHVQWRSKRDLLSLEWRYGIGQGARLNRLRWSDPDRFRAVARITWRDMGYRAFLDCVRDGYEFGALSAAVRTGATAFGRVAASIIEGREHLRASKS